MYNKWCATKQTMSNKEVQQAPAHCIVKLHPLMTPPIKLHPLMTRHLSYPIPDQYESMKPTLDLEMQLGGQVIDHEVFGTHSIWWEMCVICRIRELTSWSSDKRWCFCLWESWHDWSSPTAIRTHICTEYYGRKVIGLNVSLIRKFSLSKFCA